MSHAKRHDKAKEPHTPEADIPDLKKKEKERKKAGAVWGSGKPLGTPFAGATGGSGVAGAMARSAASAAVAEAAAGAAAPEIAGSFLARLLAWVAASRLGKIALALGAASVLAGFGLYLWGLMQGGQTPIGVGSNLGGISSTIKVHSGARGGSLGYMARTAKGELKFEEAPPAGPAPEAGPSPETPSGEKTPEAPKTDLSGILPHGGLARPDRLPHDLSGAKLTSSLGSQFAKNIFTNPGTPKFGEGFDRGRIKTLTPGAGRGPTKAFKQPAKIPVARGMTPRRGRSSRAIGQLRLARGLSMRGADVGSNDVSKQMASDAFDQRATRAGTIPDPDKAPGPSSSGGGPGSVNPMGPGATDITMPEEPRLQPDAHGRDITPYQPALNNALNMAAQAGKMKKISMMLIAIGIVLIAIGIATLPWGAILIGIGAMLLGMGIMMMMMANMMAQQAKQMANQIKNMEGQLNQGKIVDECTDQALADGTPPEACRPQTTAPPMDTTIKQDVEKERSSTYELDGGAPVNNK